LDAWGANHGIVVPPSFSEFYAFRELTDILQRDGGDRLYAVSDYQVSNREGYAVLVFMEENQAVYQWGVTLNGQPNPLVMVKVRDDPSTKWLPCAESFSTFIYTIVFDNQHCISQSQTYGKTWIAEQFQPLGNEDIEFLKSRFDEEPKTFGLPTPVTNRFSSGWAKRIMVYNHSRDDREFRNSAARAKTVEEIEKLAESRISGKYFQSCWVLSAASEEDLEDLKRLLQPRWKFPDA